MKKAKYFFLFWILLLSSSFAQVNDYISNINVHNGKEGAPLSISVGLLQTSAVSSIEFAYKAFGQNEYFSQELNILGNTATGEIPADQVSPPYIDYFFLIRLSDGSVSSYPLGAPELAAPLRYEVTPHSEKDDEIIILNPKKNTLVRASDLLISISLLRASDKVDKSATKIFINNVDVSSMALFSGDLIVFYPENFPGTLSGGPAVVRVELYDKDGKFYHSVSTKFTVVYDSESSIISPTFDYYVDVEGESRTEMFNNEQNWYNNIGAHFRGNYENWRVKARLYFTSEESAEVQPQNRYNFEIANNWFGLSLGDNFPRFPELILNGKRVRGAAGGLRLGAFKFDAAYGQVNRSVEGTLLETYDVDPLSPNVIKIDQNKYGKPYGLVKYGVFDRNLFSARAAAEGRSYSFGLSYLHAKDEMNSIDFGGKPQENALFGTDFRFGFDNNQIEVKGQAAYSIYNSDISTGTLTDEEIDDIFSNNTFLNVTPDDLKNYKKYLSSFITVNQFLSPVQPGNLSSLAGDVSLRLNYFGNYFKAKYLYRGNEFNSFGQSYLRTDVRGINLLDRIKFFSNKVFLSLGYENLVDNLHNTKPATTTFQTINSSVSVYLQKGLPSFTFGFTRYDNSNGRLDSLGIDNGTNNFSASVSYSFLAQAIHKMRISFTSSDRQDNSLYDTDASMLTVLGNLDSKWADFFSSILGIQHSSSDVGGLNYSYTTLTLGGKFELIENLLTFTLMGGKSFGDYDRLAIDFYGSYKILENLQLDFQARYYKIKDVSNNSIFGMSARFIF
ncbi:MAG: hypothetical protein GXO87_05600 [Chlorobi bacterium]|nr:hypothetical protein [Chlorobiota bacterium]